jgi:transposase-like protein
VILNRSKYSKLGPGNSFEMNEHLQSIFDGLLLGDANLMSRSAVSAGLRMEVHARSIDWLNEIHKVFSDHKVISKIEHLAPRNRLLGERTIHGGPHVSIRTLMYRNLKSEYKRWYGTGKKIIPSDVRIDALSLAHWYMGDGSLVKNTKHNLRIVFYTNGFNYDEVVAIKHRIEDHYNISGFVHRRVKPVLVFCARSAVILLDLIRPYVVPSFAYKVAAIYEITKCLLCEDELTRLNTKYCASCATYALKARNQARYSNVNVINTAKILRSRKPKCEMCDKSFIGRLGTKYCGACRPIVKQAYKMVKYKLARDPDFDFISYVRSRLGA